MTGNKKMLISGARSPVALHMTRLLHQAGHEVYMFDHLNNPLAASSSQHSGYYQLPSYRCDPQRAQADLKNLLEDKEIEIVIPTCEETINLAQLWNTSGFKARLFAPDATLVKKVHNKFGFITICKKLGLRTPETILLQSKDDLKTFVPNSTNYAFKPVWSRFASDVLLAPKHSELDRIAPTLDQPWVAQRHVAGDEISVYAIAHEGKLTALSLYRGLIKWGLGASICFEPIKCTKVQNFVESFVSGTKWTGQISFDLMRDKEDEILPLECNPRATSGIHFFKNSKQFSEAIINGSVYADPDVTTPQGVRMALWLCAPAQIFQSGEIKELARCFRMVEDVIIIPNDSVGLWAQLRSFIEMACIAFSQNISLRKASTHDLEWNGPD